jgi:4-hydroxy-3-methylbut-2-enyl diphosphate reductase
VRHEIVHKGHEVECLKTKSVRPVESLAEIPRCAPAIFCAYGLSRAAEEKAMDLDLPILDVVRLGRSMVQIGHAGHPAVERMMNPIPGSAYLAQSEDDVAALELAADTSLAYLTHATVTRTRLSADDARSIIIGAATIGVTAGVPALEVLVRGAVGLLRSLDTPEAATLPGVEEDIKFRVPSERLGA